MKAFICYFFFGVIFSFSISAQSMSDLFIAMPDSLIKILNKENRSKLIEKSKNGDEINTINSLLGKTEIKKLTEDYLFLQTTASSSIEMKLLPLNEYYNVICLINTYCGPACDSKISFYTTKWESLKNNYFPIFNDEYFFSNNLSEECTEVKNKLDMKTFEYKFTEDQLKLQVDFTIADYLNAEEYDKVKSCLNETVTYFWKDGKFELIQE